MMNTGLPEKYRITIGIPNSQFSSDGENSFYPWELLRACEFAHVEQRALQVVAMARYYPQIEHTADLVPFSLPGSPTIDEVTRGFSERNLIRPHVEHVLAYGRLKVQQPKGVPYVFLLESPYQDPELTALNRDEHQETSRFILDIIESNVEEFPGRGLLAPHMMYRWKEGSVFLGVEKK